MEKKSWRFPYFCKSYWQEKKGDFCGPPCTSISETQLFFNLVFLLKQKLTILCFRYWKLWTSHYFLESCFLESYVMLFITFLNIQIFFLLFNSETISKILSNICDGVCIKSPLTHILRSVWRKKKAKEKSILLIKSSGHIHTLIVLKNSWYLKEYLRHSGYESFNKPVA